MIGLFGADGAKLPMVYRGLTLNDPADDPKDTYEVWQALVDPEHGSVAEPKSERDGSEIYRPKKQRGLIRVTGAVKAPTAGELFDKTEALRAAFDPVNAYLADLASTSDVGFLPFTFSRPTADLANYPSGLKDLQYYARSLALPVTRITKSDGLAARFAVVMECADPRAYAQSATSASRSNAGSKAMDNTLASYASWPTVTITLTGAGTDVIQLERVAAADTSALQLDLGSCSSGDVIVVDMERRYVTKNGAAAMDLVVTAQADYWDLFPAESQTLNVTNVSGTLAGTVAVSWVKAFA